MVDTSENININITSKRKCEHRAIKLIDYTLKKM